jgi:hypothetical protein
MRFSVWTPATRFTRTFPIPQLTADTIVSPKPTTLRSWPTVIAIRTRPASATPIPVSSRREGVSRRTAAANRTVKKACVWTATDASPGGIPRAMPKNWNRNCPAKSVRPIGTSARHGTDGRARSARRARRR